MADIDLRDWKKYEDAIAAGYEATVAALQAQPAFGKPTPAPTTTDFFSLEPI